MHKVLSMQQILYCIICQHTKGHTVAFVDFTVSWLKLLFSKITIIRIGSMLYGR